MLIAYRSLDYRYIICNIWSWPTSAHLAAQLSPLDSVQPFSPLRPSAPANSGRRFEIVRLDFMISILIRRTKPNSRSVSSSLHFRPSRLAVLRLQRASSEGRAIWNSSQETNKASVVRPSETCSPDMSGDCGKERSDIIYIGMSCLPLRGFAPQGVTVFSLDFGLAVLITA